MSTVDQLLRAGARRLGGLGGSPRLDAEVLLGHALGQTREHLYRSLFSSVPAGAEERYAALLTEREARRPVAQLVGRREFWSFTLEVTGATLVPRPETELLVERALARIPPEAAWTIADLGTGSGAIAIAIAHERPDLRVVAVDVSKNALDLARANVHQHELQARVELRHGSWWAPIAANERFELVVSNPPYIDPDAPTGLAADVKAFEPPLALFTAPGDPASCHREIAAGLQQHLVPGGWFVGEAGLGSTEPARACFADQPFLQEVALLQDLAGLDRFVVARRRE